MLNYTIESFSQGLHYKQFFSLYKRAFPHSVNPSRLSASVFRLIDRDGDGLIDFREYLVSLCTPSHRYNFEFRF